MLMFSTVFFSTQGTAISFEQCHGFIAFITILSQTQVDIPYMEVTKNSNSISGVPGSLDKANGDVFRCGDSISMLRENTGFYGLLW